MSLISGIPFSQLPAFAYPQASLITTGEKANAWWGAGLFTCRLPLKQKP